MQHRSIGALSALVPSMLASSLVAQGIVSPADRATLEGSTYTAYPLGRFDARVQQLHDDLGTSARQIFAHSYRRDAAEQKGAIAAFASEMTVTLAMSPRKPANATTTFADHLGTAPVVVLPRTKLNFPATDRPALDPAPAFVHVVPYQFPFSYPAGGGTLCVDVLVHGNDAPSGKDKDFLPYLDAQDLFADGRNLQVGFRYGLGCVAPGQNNAEYAELSFLHRGTSLDLVLDARYGALGGASGPAFTGLIIGMQPGQIAWPPRPSCKLWTSSEFSFLLSGANDATGGWSGTIPGIPTIASGTTFYAQVASAQPGTGATALGDGTKLVVPPPAKLGLQAVRIASGSDRTATTGTIATQVAVIRFF